MSNNRSDNSQPQHIELTQSVSRRVVVESLQAATDEHREKITMLFFCQWPSMQSQLCKGVRAPQPLNHCDAKTPGLVTEVPALALVCSTGTSSYKDNYLQVA
jgi:hypothetical protein